MQDFDQDLDHVTVGGRRWPAADVLAALRPHVSEGRLARMQAVLAQRLGSVALGVEDLYHTHNGSACLRTAEGLGLQDVVTAELRHPYPLPDAPTPDAADDADPEGLARKVSAWSHRWLDLHRFQETESLLGWARARDMRVLPAGPRGEATLADLPIDRPLLLLFGNEAEGVRPETLAACDDTFRIPMYGFTESFNVSVSVGMALSRVVERVRAQLAAEGRAGDLPEARQTHLLARWCAASVRAAEPILRRKLG